MERLQKILAAGGLASRRAAEALITEGRVRVNGRVVSELGAKADARNDKIEVDGKRVVAEHHVYIVLHKPRGVVATMSDPEGRPTVREVLASVGARVFPVGRLDFATSGVLLVTNDGEMADGLLHPKKAVPKTYIVKVKGKMAKEDLDKWRHGVQLEDGKTIPAEAKLIRFDGDKTWFELTIKEGRNQQIRRMGEATRFPVMRLARLAFAQITADGLRPGQWRHMTRDELVQLKKVYGVPRSVAAPPPEEIAPARRLRASDRERKAPERKAPDRKGPDRKGPAPRRGAAGRAARATGNEREASAAPAQTRGAHHDTAQTRGPVGARFTSRDRVAGVAGKDGHPGRARDQRPAAPPVAPPEPAREDTHARGRPPRDDSRGGPPRGDSRGGPPRGDSRGAPTRGDSRSGPRDDRPRGRRPPR